MRFHIHLSRFALWLTLALLVALALGSVTVRYVLVPVAADYRHDLEQVAKQVLGQPVAIGQLAASVNGLKPQLELKDVVLGGDSGQPLRFGRLSLALDPWRSVLAQAPVLAGVGLAEGAVTLQKLASGEWRVAGLPVREGRPDWLLTTGHLFLQDIELSLEDAEEPGAFLLGRIDLDIANDGARRRLDASLTPVPEFGSELRLSAELSGDLFGPDWHGRIYLEGSGLKTGRLTQLAGLPLHQQAGGADLKLWTEWENAAPRRAVAWFDWDRAVLAYPTADGKGQLGVDGIGGWLRWQRQPDGWRLNGHQVRFGLIQSAEPPMDFALDYRQEGKQVALAASALNLGELRVVADAVAPLDPALKERLHAMAPRGELRNVRGYRANGRWAVATEMHDIGFNPWQGMPGMSGFNAVVHCDDRHGSLSFAMEGGEVRIPTVFRDAIAASRLHGNLRWERAADGWRLAATGLELHSSGLDFGGHFALELPDRPDASPWMDLRLRLGPGDLPALKRFLPYGVIPVTSAWLQSALTAGRVEGVRMVLSGPLADYPFRDGEGVFEVAVDARDVDLQYQPHWPPLKGVDASLLFAGPTMSISASRGTIGEGRICWATAEVADLERAPWLAVAGEVEASVAQAMDFLAASPLADIPSRMRRFANMGGESDIALDLRLPLQPGLGEPVVNGTASLKSASLQFPQLQQTLGSLVGDLHFTAEDLDAHGLQAQFLGAPVQLDLAGDHSDIVVNAAGEARTDSLRSAFPGDAWQYFGGEADYRLQLVIPKAMDAADAPLRALLESDLSGLAVQLPDPLAKTARSRAPLRVELHVQSGKPTPLKLHYRDLEADLVLAPPSEGFSFKQGRLGLGSPLPAAVPGGLSVALGLPVLEAAPWYELFHRHESSADGGAVLAAVSVDLAELSWHGRDLGHVSLRAAQAGDGWKGEGDTAFGAGQFHYRRPPAGPATLSLELDQLRIPKGDGEDRSASDEALDPAALPALQIASRKLVWHDRELGSLDLQTRPVPQGLEISGLNLRKDQHALKLTGNWLGPAGAGETRLRGRLRTGDLGELLADFGYAREIRDSPTKLGFDLAWPGAPQRIGLASLRGDVRMELGRGSVLNVDPGLGRALGVLNLGTLRRLLLLDFSDLFGKGMAYDGMKGVFHLADGQAHTEAFLIDAAAARIFVTGRVGLVTKDLDETVAVMPHTLASIPMAGALMGGAAVGMAYNFAQTLMGEKTVSIASTTYRVQGSWDNPAIERIEGNMPLELINRTWSDVKSLSGFESDPEENQP